MTDQEAGSLMCNGSRRDRRCRSRRLTALYVRYCRWDSCREVSRSLACLCREPPATIFGDRFHRAVSIGDLKTAVRHVDEIVECLVAKAKTCGWWKYAVAVPGSRYFIERMVLGAIKKAEVGCGRWLRLQGGGRDCIENPHF